MCEGEAGFGLSQLVEVVEAHNVRRFKMTLGIFVTFPTPSYLIVKLGGGQRRQEGCVGTGDAHSII